MTSARSRHDFKVSACTIAASRMLVKNRTCATGDDATRAAVLMTITYVVDRVASTTKADI